MLALRPISIVFVTAIATSLSVTAPLHGQIQIYVEPGDLSNGEAVRFNSDNAQLPNLLAIETEDFDDATGLFPPATRVSVVSYFDDRVWLDISTNAPDAAGWIFQSTFYFDYLDAVDFQAMVMGSSTATITIDSDDVIVASLGFWVFDDGSARSSAFRVSVLDRFGRTAETVLENLGSRINGYQMEGFVGVSSLVGISSVSITPIDPVTGEAWLDVFEIDTMTVALLPEPQIADDPDEIPLPDEDTVTDDDDEADVPDPTVTNPRHCKNSRERTRHRRHANNASSFRRHDGQRQRRRSRCDRRNSNNRVRDRATCRDKNSRSRRR